MTTTIASNNPGRSIATYDLLDEITEQFSLNRRDAHESIHALLDQLVADDDTVVLEQTPMRPELLKSNPADVDVDYWITISDDAADIIRESIAATHE